MTPMKNPIVRLYKVSYQYAIEGEDPDGQVYEVRIVKREFKMACCGGWSAAMEVAKTYVEMLEGAPPMDDSATGFILTSVELLDEPVLVIDPPLLSEIREEMKEGFVDSLSQLLMAVECHASDD